MSLPARGLSRTAENQGRHSEGEFAAAGQDGIAGWAKGPRFAAVELSQPDAVASARGFRVHAGVFQGFVACADGRGELPDQLAVAESSDRGAVEIGARRQGSRRVARNRTVCK